MLKECELEKASRFYKARTGVGCHSFHLKIPLDFTRVTREEIVEFLEKVENGRNKIVRRCFS